MKYVVLSLSAVATGGLYLEARSGLGGWHCCPSQAETAEIFVETAIQPVLQQFHTAVGRYPTTTEGLTALLHAPKGTEQQWSGPYLEGGKIPRDPWGREFRYRATHNYGIGYEVRSLGPDGVLSADDIGNWPN